MSDDNEGGNDLLTGLFRAAVDHYSREAILTGLDYIAALSEAEIKEWSSGMTLEQKSRVMRVWQAARGDALVNVNP
jgi:hypothetical protein